MTSEYDRRAAIIVALRAGRSRSEIADFLKLPTSTVYAVANRFFSAEATEGGSGDAERKPHDRSLSRRRSQDFIDSLEELVEEDPSQSTRTLAAKLNVGATTIRQALKEDLRCKSYRLKVRQMLSDTMRTKRVERCSLLLTSLKRSAAGRIRFFSDEKIFCVDAKVNRQNDRWIAQDPEDVPVIGRTKHPASIHVLMVISSEGHVMPPHFFQKGQNVNTAVYLNVLRDVIKPWMVEMADGNPYVFQQDGAPAHTSHLVQNWLEDNVDMFWSKHFWPPNSPDLNPLDFYLWSVIERESNKRSHNNVDSLRAAIEEAAATIPADHVINACRRFRSRLEAVVEADGGWIE